jgi:hypothetical protein
MGGGVQVGERGLDQEPGGAGFWRSRTAFALGAFLAIAAFCLLTEHTAHSFGLLPFLLLHGLLFLPIFTPGAYDDAYGHDGPQAA